MPRRALLLIGLVALVHAGAYIAHQGGGSGEAWTDQAGYRRLGAALAETGRFTRYPDSAVFVPEVIRTPVYPAFVALVYTLFGVNNDLAVAWSQALLFVGLCLLVYGIARRFVEQRLAVAAAAATALFSPLPYFGALVLTELLTTFLLTLGLWAALRARESGRWRDAGVAGLVVAATALARPVFILLPFALFGVLAALDGRRTWRQWSAAIVVALLAVTPWFAYNYVNLGRLTLSPAGGLGRATWEGSWQGRWRGRLHNELTLTAERLSDRAALDAEVRRLAAEARLDPAPMLEYVHQWQDIRRIWDEPADPSDRATARSLADEEYLRVGRDNIRRDPVGHVWRRLTHGMFVMWAAHIPYRYEAINDLPVGAVRAMWAVQVAIVLLAVWGVLGAIGSGRWREALVLAVPALYVTATHLPLASEPRVSLPAMPAVLILATAGASHAIAALTRRRSAGLHG
jgi:4-amino-4-deoxy-L-arabinose transferase-like glycosyltransferase